MSSYSPQRVRGLNDVWGPVVGDRKDTQVQQHRQDGVWCAQKWQWALQGCRGVGEVDSERMGSWQGEGRVLVALRFNLDERKVSGRVLDRKMWYYVRTSRSILTVLEEVETQGEQLRIYKNNVKISKSDLCWRSGRTCWGVIGSRGFWRRTGHCSLMHSMQGKKEVRRQLELSFSKIGKIARSALGLKTNRFRDISFNVPRGIKMAIRCNLS